MTENENVRETLKKVLQEKSSATQKATFANKRVRKKGKTHIMN